MDCVPADDDDRKDPPVAIDSDDKKSPLVVPDKKMAPIEEKCETKCQSVK